tara:strand:+ start:185 stop:520 length:336 start_codon:yes stop_codon:yes gene_type:complete
MERTRQELHDQVDALTEDADDREEVLAQILHRLDALEEAQSRTLELSVGGTPARIPGVAGWKRAESPVRPIGATPDDGERTILLNEAGEFICVTDASPAEVKAAWRAGENT